MAAWWASLQMVVHEDNLILIFSRSNSNWAEYLTELQIYSLAIVHNVVIRCQ